MGGGLDALLSVDVPGHACSPGSDLLHCDPVDHCSCHLPLCHDSSSRLHSCLRHHVSSDFSESLLLSYAVDFHWCFHCSPHRFTLLCCVACERGCSRWCGSCLSIRCHVALADSDVVDVTCSFFWDSWGLADLPSVRGCICPPFCCGLLFLGGYVYIMEPVYFFMVT